MEPAPENMDVTPKPIRRFAPLLLLMACLFSFSNAFALFNRGGGLGVGVRAMGLSGAFVAVADDPSASYWNPAGLAQLGQAEILGMFGSYFNDKDRNLDLSFHYPLDNGVHLALSYNNLFFTDIPGAQEGRYGGSLAIPLEFVPGKRFMLGVSFHFLAADLGNGNGSAQGTGVDVGLLFRNPFKDDTEFRAGLLLSDVSTSVRFDATGAEQVVPPLLTVGLAYRLDKATLLAADIPWTLSDDPLLNGENIRFRTGMERWFFDGRFGLRAGFISFLTLPGEFSVGASYRPGDLSLEYCFMNHPDQLGNSHRFSIGYTFPTAGKGTPEPKPFMVQSLVGDGKIYLKWAVPSGSRAEGYLVYFRSDKDKEFHRAKKEALLTNYCLLQGAQNGVRYHLIIRSLVDGQERFSCDEWVAVPRPLSADAKKYYDQGIALLDGKKPKAALYPARKAEQLDPNNYDVKNLIHQLETNPPEELVPGEDGN